MGHLLDLPTGTRLYRLDNNKVKVGSISNRRSLSDRSYTHNYLDTSNLRTPFPLKLVKGKKVKVWTLAIAPFT